MDGALEKLRRCLKRNGAVLLVLLVGIALMLWPERKPQEPQPQPVLRQTLEEQLEVLLSQAAGAGSTRVLLSRDTGEQTVYQTDETRSTQPDRQEEKTATVLVSDSGRQKEGLVRETRAPTYRGAVVVCQGGDDPKVRLAVVEAVSGATGLPSNKIVVLKMK